MIKHINLHFQETKWTLSNIDYKNKPYPGKAAENQTSKENLKTNQRKMTNYITEEITQKTVAFKIWRPGNSRMIFLKCQRKKQST